MQGELLDSGIAQVCELCVVADERAEQASAIARCTPQSELECWPLGHARNWYPINLDTLGDRINGVSISISALCVVIFWSLGHSSCIEMFYLHLGLNTFPTTEVSFCKGLFCHHTSPMYI